MSYGAHQRAIALGDHRGPARICHEDGSGLWAFSIQVIFIWWEMLATT